MELSTLLTLVGFTLTLVIQLITFAFFSGKYTESTETMQKQVGQLATDRLKDNERIDKLEEKMTDRYQDVDKDMIKVTTIVSKTEKDIQEIKETFKEFTHEMKETFREFAKEIREMVRPKK
jgi:archaellum component FlaC